MMENKRKLILDCDPGTYDSVCIMMALTHPDVELLAITTESGNLPSDKTAANALRILEHLGRTDIPVAQGMLHPLVREYPKDPYCHGEDGLGNHFFPEPVTKVIDRFPANVIIDEVMKYPGEVSLVCTAPLTNVAMAIMMEPEIVPLIKEIYHIGGSYGFTDYAFTNATGDNPMSEWNVYVDPEAAKIVYESGVNITTIGLDVAFNPEAVNLSDETLEQIRRIGNPQAKYALEIIDYIDKNNSIEEKGIYINGPIDTTAMCSFLCPDMLTTKEIKVAVDTGSQLTRGMTIWDRRDHFRWEDLHTIRSAVSIDSDMYQKVFVEALGNAAGES